jgi:ATP-dependent DNA ligase
MADAPGPNVPFPPMEAELVSELPSGGGWRYEPKWDGFRGVLENDGGELALWSRNGRPLLRYFPELRPLGQLLPPHSALDGEIVIARGGALDFDAMQMRLHPAESRVRKLSGEIPATFVAFDLLLWKGKPVHERPIEKRRAELEKVGAGFRLSPVSDLVEQGTEWLRTLQAAGFDGVIAKRLGLPYLPGSRDGVVKVKPHKTADCVVAGIRWKKGGRETIATLLLGLYDDEGDLDYVGSAAVGAKNQAEIQGLVLPLVDSKSDRRFSEPNRWGTGELEETPLKPKLVVEVRFDKLEKRRFRHGTRLLRFRPDKDPADCTWREVRPPRSPDDLAVEDLLRYPARWTTSPSTTVSSTGSSGSSSGPHSTGSSAKTVRSAAKPGRIRPSRVSSPIVAAAAVV